MLGGGQKEEVDDEDAEEEPSDQETSLQDKSGISSANLVSNRQRWVREHPMERRNGPTTVALPSG